MILQRDQKASESDSIGYYRRLQHRYERVDRYRWYSCMNYLIDMNRGLQLATVSLCILNIDIPLIHRFLLYLSFFITEYLVDTSEGRKRRRQNKNKNSTPEVAKSARARRSWFALSDYFGLNSAFLTVAPDDIQRE